MLAHQTILCQPFAQPAICNLRTRTADLVQLLNALPHTKVVAGFSALLGHFTANRLVGCLEKRLERRRLFWWLDLDSLFAMAQASPVTLSRASYDFSLRKLWFSLMESLRPLSARDGSGSEALGCTERPVAVEALVRHASRTGNCP